ncbi:MAG TPA: pilus assembly protein PilM [Spirochaetota bacterium]|nr:pilus assembly protein PilM [Spirochaetota bacterium]HRZ25612.1 pilus assembly protein PilM [Spirochaetota bacterium]
MFENLAAIDIGTTSIKALSIKTGFKDFQIRSFLTENIDPEKENRAEAVKEALLHVLEDESIKGCRIITTVPMDRAIVRNLTFPFNDMKKIADVVPFEAEENIPFPLSELVVDFQPMQSAEESGRILLAAVRKENLGEILAPFSENGVTPFRAGLESNALFECYRYFTTVEDENILQLHIGHTKTIMNIVSGQKLLYSRSIPAGIGLVLETVSDCMKMGRGEAEKLLLALSLDLVSLDNNLQRDTYKTLGIPRPKLKEIFTSAVEMTGGLIEQMNLTVKAFEAEFGETVFSRILVSGGGACMSGIGSLISRELGLPVVSHPFFENFRNDNLDLVFQPALGSVLAYLNRKSDYVDFLKDEFTPEETFSARRMYFLAAGFGILSVVMLAINLISSAVMSSSMNSQYDEILNQHFKRYFRTAPKTDNQIAEAMKILNKEKKELKSIEVFFTKDESVMDILNDMLSHFPPNTNFTLKNLVINERIIRIDGSVSSSQAIEDFKEKIKQTEKYESVTMNIKSSRKDEISFSMTIKMKLPPANG